jgi:hypothetical protein
MEKWGKNYSVTKKTGIVAITLDRETGEENIAMVDTRAAAGYPQYFLEPEYLVDLLVQFTWSSVRNSTSAAFR